MSRSSAVAIVAALSASIVVPACDAVPDPPRGSRTIRIDVASGGGLEAVEVGDGPEVVVMSHGATGTKEDFYGPAEAFADSGWRAIAYDARSAGTREADLDAAVRFARASGARDVVLMGGSLGASLSIASAERVGASAVVALSPATDAFDAAAAAGALGASGIPLLVIAAEADEPFATDARTIAERAGVDPVIVSGDRHGTGVFVDHPDLIGDVVAFCRRAVSAAS